MIIDLGKINNFYQNIFCSNETIWRLHEIKQKFSFLVYGYRLADEPVELGNINLVSRYMINVGLPINSG
jgi:hypothetical protein